MECAFTSPLTWGRLQDVPSGTRITVKGGRLVIRADDEFAEIHGLCFRATATCSFRRDEKGRLMRLVSNVSFKVGNHPTKLWLEV